MIFNYWMKSIKNPQNEIHSYRKTPLVYQFKYMTSYVPLTDATRYDKCHFLVGRSIFSCRYLVTEGQIFSVYIITLVLMFLWILIERRKNNVLDINGQFLLYTFTATFILIAVWVGYLWNDEALRKKYPGLLYVPEPWSYYTLHLKQ